MRQKSSGTHQARDVQLLRGLDHVKKLIGSASALALLTAASMANAQAATAADDAVEGIIVTGTRSTVRTVTSSMAPIDVLPAVELIRSGKQSPRDLVSTLVPSATTSNSGAGASFAVKTVSLRGLNADQVLVLVNGKRRHNTAILFVNGTTQNGQSPPDLDLIPSSGIDRIEVLRDGASAQYGSDALAGVVNLILKNRPSGGNLSFLGGETFHGDGRTGQLSGNIGLPVGQGSLNLSFDARSSDYTDRGRPYPSTSLFFPTVGGAPDPREATVNRYINHVGQPAIQVIGGSYDFSYPVGDVGEVYAFGTQTKRKSRAWLTPRLPGNSANIIAVYPEGYSPKLRLHDDDYQHALGFKGKDLLGFGYDLSTTFSRDRVDYDGDTLNASLGPASPKFFYLGALETHEWTSNFDLTRELATGLFEKPLFLALGAEYRKNKLEIDAGQVESYVDGRYVAPAGLPNAGVITQAGAQGVTGFPPFAAGEFSRDNVSFYANGEQTVAKGWEVSLAGRYEHYSDFGTATTFKASTRYEPVDGYAIRATASTGFRAPTLQQEHYASASTIGVRLPGDATTSLYPVQLLPPTTAAAQALGATPLEPEKSTNYSAGLVLQPMRRMNVTVDVYQIKITDRIIQSGSLGPAVAVSDALRAAGLNPQQAAFFYINGADTRTRGLDFVVDYRHDFGAAGAFKWTLSANFNKTKFLSIRQPPPALAAAGLVLIDRVRIGDFTVGNPQNKFIFSTNWQIWRFDTTLRLTRYGEAKSTASVAAGGAAFDETVSPALIVDIDSTFKITDQLTFTVGANNLLNKYPDKVIPANRGATNYTFYNGYSPYGISGGFYYGRINYAF
jgi:iron complex outermembrane receptor protein